jgi:hypothetical protein
VLSELVIGSVVGSVVGSPVDDDGGSVVVGSPLLDTVVDALLPDDGPLVVSSPVVEPPSDPTPSSPQATQGSESARTNDVTWRRVMAILARGLLRVR